MVLRSETSLSARPQPSPTGAGSASGVRGVGPPGSGGGSRARAVGSPSILGDRGRSRWRVEAGVTVSDPAFGAALGVPIAGATGSRLPHGFSVPVGHRGEEWSQAGCISTGAGSVARWTAVWGGNVVDERTDAEPRAERPHMPGYLAPGAGGTLSWSWAEERLRSSRSTGWPQSGHPEGRT